jgi:hypothetical protein
MNHLLRQFEEHFSQYLTPTQTQTLFILIGLLNQYKQVKIEKLATYFPVTAHRNKNTLLTTGK